MKHSTIRIAAALLGTGALLQVSTAPAAPATSSAVSARDVEFSIAPQTLSSALIEFSKQSGVQVLTPGERMKDIGTRGVRGKLGIEAALRQLLKDTGVSFEFVGSDTIVLKVRAVPAVAMVAVGGAAEPGAAGVDESRDGREVQQVVVEDKRFRGLDGSNADIPRTINDAQPYYIFDAATIERSGTTSVEDFLKQRLTMNTVGLTNGQRSSPTSANTSGNLSTINLRGLGADKTLILVNGRRIPGVTIDTGQEVAQPDVNGISLSAIDRIEVMPSSASGIYGASAIGGVINIILKRNHVGGEVRATYDNTLDADSRARTVSATYGLGLEGGKTHVMLNASFADSRSLLVEDRRKIFQRNIATILGNSPAFLYSATLPWLGSVPNITAATAAAETLQLKDGTVIASRNTYIPAGTAPGVSRADLSAGLRANAGVWNFEMPYTTQRPAGLLRPFGVTPETRSLMLSVRRQMTDRLELFVDASQGENRSESIYNSSSSPISVSQITPSSPFITTVNVMTPVAEALPVTTESVTRSFTAGAILRLPRNWTGQADYTWTENRFSYQFYDGDIFARSADLTSGVLNPFVDTMLYPLNLAKYSVPYGYVGKTRLNDVAVRASGPLGSLPWGAPTLTFGLEHRALSNPENGYEVTYAITVARSFRSTYYAREQETNSAYAELHIPLVKQGWMRGVRSLELQLAGRAERYEVDSGTRGVTYYPNTGVTEYLGVTRNNQPYFSRTSYRSNNETVGLKYEPTEGVILRASLASAFLPPTPAQLLQNPIPSAGTLLVNDPVSGQNGVPVYTLGGGNPGVIPQSSRSFNAGIIWEPRAPLLKGLRLNAEHYRIEQDNAIANLTAQQLVDLQDTYPDRFVRNASGTITQVDISAMNLYKREVAGWDLSADYSRNVGKGVLGLRMVESIISHLKNQYSPTLAMSDAVGFPAENGALEYRTNLSLSWEQGPWTADWTVRYMSSYRQSGAAGGPGATQRAMTGTTPAGRLPSTLYTLPQGGDVIPSQMYHDLVVGLALGRTRVGASRLGGTSVQLGVRNIFDRVPPFDVRYSETFYASPFGDLRLRSYWLNARKQF